MADKSLVKGAAVLGSTTGFTDYSKQFKGSDAATQARLGLAVKQKQEAEVARVTGEINSYMSQLKSDISFRDLNAGSQNTMKSWLGSKRNEYAYAANQISKIQDASSPEYQQYADIMNQINNDISNLSDQVKAYKENKLAFVDMNEKDMWSAGNNPESNQQAQLIYGLGDFTPPMQINGNGDLAFNINGNNVRFNDYKSPFLKDYKTATYITNQANTIYNSGAKLTDAKRNTIRLGLEQQLADPNSLKSVISNDFTVDGLDFSNIVFNPEDIAGTRSQVIDAILNGYDSVAATGYNEKQNKNGGSNVNPGSVDNQDVYTNTGGAFKTLGDLDQGYFEMAQIQDQYINEPDPKKKAAGNKVYSISPNVAFKYAPGAIINIKDDENNVTGQRQVLGRWTKMVRSGQSGTFKPAKTPDNSAEQIYNLRNWYLMSSGQISEKEFRLKEEKIKNQL